MHIYIHYTLCTKTICSMVGNEARPVKKEMREKITMRINNCHMVRRYTNSHVWAHTHTHLSHLFSWQSVITDTLLTMIALVGISISRIALFIYTHKCIYTCKCMHACMPPLFYCVFQVLCSYLSCFEGKYIYNITSPSACFHLNGIHLRGTHHWRN